MNARCWWLASAGIVEQQDPTAEVPRSSSVVQRCLFLANLMQSASQAHDIEWTTSEPPGPRSSCEPLALGSTRTKKHERLASFKTLRSKNRLFPARLDPFPGGLTLASCEFLDTTSNCPSITLPFLGGSVSPYRKLSRQWRYAIKARFPAAGTHYPHCRIQSLLGRRVSTKEGCWVAILPGSNAPNDPRCRMGDPSVCKSRRGEAYA